MSLQELAGSSIHLKLSVREGHGFGFLKSPVIVVAGTNGIFLETEVVPPSPDPLFHIDLVWETDKRNLRRFRASNTPIKLECFTVSPSGQRDGIGSILLNIKSAQVIPRGSQNNVNERWYKLIGVPVEAKALQPELLLSLTIQEPSALIQPLSGSALEGNKAQDPILPVRQLTGMDSSNMQKSLPPVKAPSVPSPEYKTGYIQLGPETSCLDTFLLKLTVKRALEMELLLRGHPGLVNVSGTTKPLQISFSLMGHGMRTKPFGGQSLCKVYQVDDEVILPLRTSLSALHSYLQENPCVAVCLLYCEQEIAAAELHIRSLVPTNDVQSFSHEFGGQTAFTQKCMLVSSSCGSIPLQDGHQPSVEVTTELQLTSSNSTPLKILSVSNQMKPLSDSTSLQACVTSKEDPSSRSESRQSQDTFVLTSQNGPVWVPVAPGLTQPYSPSTNNENNSLCLEKEEGHSTKSVVIKVVPNHVEFYQLPKTPWVRFLFECPKSSTVASKFTDLYVPQNQSSISVEGICATISNHSVDSIQVHILEIGTDFTTSHQFATAKIGPDTLLFKEKKKSIVSSDLKGPRGDQSLGMLRMTVSFEECPEEFISKTRPGRIVTDPQPSCNVASALIQPLLFGSDTLKEKNFRNPTVVQENGRPLDFDSQAVKYLNSFEDAIQPPFVKLSSAPRKSPTNQSHTPPHTHEEITSTAHFDSSTAFKIVEELEDWKEKQQEIFLAELKQKEVQHIAHITEEWTKKTKVQDIELENKMAECKTIAAALTSAKQDLKDRLKTCATKEEELRKAKEELDLQYNMKFQELTLAAKRLDEGVKLKVALMESKCSKLEERLKELESENETLRHQLYQKVSTPTHQSNVQTCGMSHSQVSQLLDQVDQLEGKLHASLESKAYFKEQWGRAVREMNQAKLQYTKTSENSKCLENVLSREETELQKDQRTLEKLREELAYFNPN